MASVAYAIEATTGQYDATAFGYINGLKSKINDAASILGTEVSLKHLKPPCARVRGQRNYEWVCRV